MDPRTGRMITSKYTIAVSFTPDTERYNPFVFRTSELYLIRAEAYLKLGQIQKAEEDLNVIIGRALQKEPKEIDLDYEGEDGLMELIKRERAIELSYVGHKFIDNVG